MLQPEHDPGAEGSSDGPCALAAATLPAPRSLSLSAYSSNDRKPDPNPPLLPPPKQGTKHAGTRQVRTEGLMLRLQTNTTSADFPAQREEEQLSCDNISTRAKFSGLFSEIQMLGKYNLIISRRGKSSAESLMLLFSIISPHPAAAAHF